MPIFELWDTTTGIKQYHQEMGSLEARETNQAYERVGSTLFWTKQDLSPGRRTLAVIREGARIKVIREED